MKGFQYLTPCGSVSLGVVGEVFTIERFCPWHGGCDDTLCAIKLACDLAQSNPGLLEGEIGQFLVPGQTIINTKGEVVPLDEGLRREILKLVQEIRQLITE